MNALQRLHAEQDQSPWIDFIDRKLIESGRLAELVGRRDPWPHQQPDHLRQGGRHRPVRRADPARDRGRRRQPGDLRGDRGRATSSDAADVLRSVYDEADGADGFVSIEVEPTWRTTPRARWSARDTCGGRVGAPERLRQDPGHARRAAGHRGCHRRGDQHQHHPDVQRRRLPGRGAGLHRRPAAAPGARRGRDAAWHRSPASSSAGSTPRSTKQLDAIGHRCRPRPARASAPSPTPSWPTTPTRRSSMATEFADLRDCRGARAALPVGEHLDQESRLPRRAVRRGADRPADGRHHAAGDDRSVPRPRPPGADARPGRGRRARDAAPDRGAGDQHAARSPTS